MNIFATHSDPNACAKVLDNVRLNKMIVETAQLLSTCHHVSNSPEVVLAELYRPTHKNHPVCKWVRHSIENYEWTVQYGLALCKEYTTRRDRIHKTQAVIEVCRDYQPYLPSCGVRGEFVNCTPYKDEEDVCIAYQKLLDDKWNNDRREPRWA